MRVITELRGMFVNGKLRFAVEASHPYEGEVVSAKGQAQNEVVATGPWEGQVPYLQQLFSGASNLMTQPLKYPSQPTVATNPQLQQNQQNILDTITGNQPVINNAVGTAQSMATTANPVSQTAQPLMGPLAAGILALMGGMNPALSQAQALAPQANTAISTAVSGAGGPINTQGAPQNAVGGMNITGELEKSLAGGSLNPFLDQIIQGATRSMNRQFETQTIPGIRDAAMAAGQRGGSSEGIARGLAAENLQDNVGDVVGRIFGQAFDSGAAERQNAMGIISNANAQNPQLQLQTAALQNQQTGLGLNAADMILQTLLGGSGQQLQGMSTGTAQAGDLLSTGSAQGMQQMFQALNMIPSLQNAGLAQLGVGNQVGLQMLGQDQAQIDSEIAKFFFEQYAPYAQLAQFQNFIGGNYGSSVPNPPQKDKRGWLEILHDPFGLVQM